MKDNTLYVKVKQDSRVPNKNVYIEDIAKLYSTDKEMVKRLNKVLFYYSKKQDNSKYMFTFLRLLELIHKEYPNVSVENIGEADFIVEIVSTEQKKKWREVLKIILICTIAFFGSAFSIMTFNTDVSVGDVFQNVYKLVLGENRQSEFMIVESAYSIGICIGIIGFFNHFSRWKLHNDPTPIQVEMRTYEENVNKALIQDAAREGKTIDAD